LALCMWTILRLFSNARLTAELLRSVAMFLALAALPAISINPWSNSGSFRKIVFPAEILFVLYLAFRYLRGKWPQPSWAISAIMVFHFVLWSREFGPFHAIYSMMFRLPQFRAHMLFIPDGAPVAWTLAFGSAIAWVFYVRRSPKPV